MGQRFERNEIEKLLNDLKEKDEEITNLKDRIKRLNEYKADSEQTIKGYIESLNAEKLKNKELNTQIATQQQLIRHKNESLTKTRNELSEFEEKYHELMRREQNVQNVPTMEEEKSESEYIEPLPSKLKEACSVYLDSIQSVNEIVARFDHLKKQHLATKENMNVIQQQIIKSNEALNKLKERNNIRDSVENPFENDAYSAILQKTPSFPDIQWEISPILIN